VALAYNGAAAAAAASLKPMRIMSLNLCTDGLLLDLVAAERITSVTYLARSRSDAYRWAEAARVPINYGLAEEVLIQKPDLVLAGTYTTTATRTLLKKVGVPLLEVPPASSFEEIRAVTRSVASALQAQAVGEALLAKMDRTLAELAANPPRRAITVAGWTGGGSVPGRGTLFDAILTAAGGINIAAAHQGRTGGSFDVEELLMARPDVLAYGADSDGAPALRKDVDQHPLILKIYKNRRVTYPESLFSCGVPETAEGAVALRASLLAAMPDVPP
jgi:iron complex transport system substrate-binding protein